MGKTVKVSIDVNVSQKATSKRRAASRRHVSDSDRERMATVSAANVVEAVVLPGRLISGGPMKASVSPQTLSRLGANGQRNRGARVVRRENQEVGSSAKKGGKGGLEGRARNAKGQLT